MQCDKCPVEEQKTVDSFLLNAFYIKYHLLANSLRKSKRYCSKQQERFIPTIEFYALHKTTEFLKELKHFLLFGNVMLYIPQRHFTSAAHLFWKRVLQKKSSSFSLIYAVNAMFWSMNTQFVVLFIVVNISFGALVLTLA